MENQSLKQTVALLALLALLCVTDASAAPPAVGDADETVVETDIDFDVPQKEALEDMTIKPAVKFRKAPAPSPLSKVELTEQDIIQLNRGLKQMIEENEHLLQENNSMDKELRTLRGQRSIDETKTNSVIIERDAYKKQNDKILMLNKNYERDIADLTARVAAKEKELAAMPKPEVQDLAESLGLSQLSAKSKSSAAGKPHAEAKQAVIASQNKSLDVISMIDKLNDNSQQLRRDEARVHYNMGNLFFNQGDYHKSIREYKEAIRIMPQDASAHFNLAFVSGEYLDDPKTALRHYRQYLRLTPQAEDFALVQEKIVDAQIRLKTRLDSHIENNLHREKNDISVP